MFIFLNELNRFWPDQNCLDCLRMSATELTNVVLDVKQRYPQTRLNTPNERIEHNLLFIY